VAAASPAEEAFTEEVFPEAEAFMVAAASEEAEAFTEEVTDK